MRAVCTYLNERIPGPSMVRSSLGLEEITKGDHAMCSKLSQIHTLSAAVIGFAASLVLAPAAMAQDEGSSPASATNDDSQEQVTISSARRSPTRSSIGAPIHEVTMSMPVSYGDLNLHTGEGVYTLRQRVKYTATRVCNRLSFQYPIGFPISDSCYSRAVRGAMPQADSAVWNYRSPNGL
jgi:UrcA family protein